MSKTVYFSAALAQQKQFGHNYQRIVILLKKNNYLVLQDTPATRSSITINRTDCNYVHYYEKVIKLINQAELVVLEVSFPSTLRIGHELTLALNKQIPVIALYHTRHEPSFFLGLEHPLIQWVSYDEGNLKERLIHALSHSYYTKYQRYNLLLSQRHYNFLELRAQQHNMPKSTFVRKLIEKEMSSS